MDTNIQQIIKERYAELPANIQQAIKSSDLAEKFKKIADKHGLMLDQNGALQTETLLVMLGLEPTESYIGNIQSALEIPSSKASDIANDVNTEILNSIKDSLRKLQERTEEESVSDVPENLPVASTISAIEQAGQFTVENQPASHSEQYNDSTITKEAVLNKIEEDHIPLVDHLLTTPVSNPQKVEVKTEVKKPYTADPYREQLK